jgi:hypothetical protein
MNIPCSACSQAPEKHPFFIGNSDLTERPFPFKKAILMDEVVSGRLVKQPEITGFS